VLLIADEIITGFGRTGRWFALGHWNVQPDLVTFAKGVTSAYLPLGGVMLSKHVHDALQEAPPDKKFMHAATYSGHPACCAVALRNLDILEQEGLVERAGSMGRRLLKGLETPRDLPAGGDVRWFGWGLQSRKHLDDRGIEIAARALHDVDVGVLRGPRGPVGSIRPQRKPDVHHREDPRGQRDLLTLEAAGVSRSVPPLVMAVRD